MFTAKDAMNFWTKNFNKREKEDKKELLKFIKYKVKQIGNKTIVVSYERFPSFNNLNKFIEFLAPLGYRVVEKKVYDSSIITLGVKIYIDEEDWKNDKDN